MSTRRKVKYREEYTEHFPSTKRAGTEYEAFCKICGSYISISNGGRRDINDHVQSKNRKTAVGLSSSKQLTSFFKTQTDGNKVAAAEATFAFHCVKHHHSYNAQLYEEFERQRGPAWRRPRRSWVRRCLLSGVLEVRARRLLLLRLGRWRPAAGWPADELLRACGLCGEVAALEPAAQLSGVHAVFDMRGLGLEQLRALSPAFARTMVHYLANCFPIRINGVHVVNEPAIFGLVFSLFKSLLNERMQKRLFLHGHDLESLHSRITPDLLPPDLGGSGKETDLQEWLSYVFSQPVTAGLKKVGYIFEDDLII